MSVEHPFVIDGVRHDSDCEILCTPAFQAQRRACTCGASWRENKRHAEAVERERIACMVERLDNTMMDQAKLAAYGRRLYEYEHGVMMIYDPHGCDPEYRKPWWRTPFDGCFGDRTDSPSRCNWIVTYPEWML